MGHSGRMPQVLIVYMLHFLLQVYVVFAIVYVHIVDRKSPTQCNDYLPSITGESPAPFTQITNKEICDGLWMPRVEKHLEWTKHYTSALEAKGRYTLIIWPEHCIVRAAAAYLILLFLPCYCIRQLFVVFYHVKCIHCVVACLLSTSLPV